MRKEGLQIAQGKAIILNYRNLPDVFHTLFGLGGLSLLNFRGLKRISPVYCLPIEE